MPHSFTRRIFGKESRPALAAELADKNKAVGSTKVVASGSQKFGDIAAWAKQYVNASGHAAVTMGSVNVIGSNIKTPGGKTFVSPGTDAVNLRDEAYMKKHGFDPGAATYRRLD